MSIEMLLNNVPAEAVYRRQALRDSDNALGPWRDALRRFSKADDERDLWMRAIFTAAEGRGGTGAHSVEDAQALQDLVERNHEAMELLSEGAARQRLQFPPIEVGSELDDDSEFVLRLSELARLPLIRAKLFAARDDAAAAGHELLTALRVGEMICQGEGQVLHYLIGLWIRSAALTGMQRMAERFPDATDMRRQFAAAVEEEMRTPEGLPVSIRADFCCISLPQLARAPEDRDLPRLVAGLLKTYYYGPQNPDAEDRADVGAPADDWRHEQMMYLLQDHSQPFDKLATARLMGEMVRDAVRHLQDLLRPPRFDVIAHADHLRRYLRRRRLERQVSLWPAELLPGASETGPEQAAAMAPRQTPPPGTRQFARPFSSLNLAALRQKFRRVSNPVGQMLAAYLLAPDYSEFMLDYCGKLERARRVLSGGLHV